jgi:glutaconyl-CoA decarboxylase
MASAEPLGFCGYSIVSPKGFFDEAGAEEIINATRHFKSVPPGSVKVHHDVTGFFRAVFDEEKQVLDAIKDYMDDLPAYQPRFFRVARPAEPAYSPSEIASIIPVNKKRVYDFEQVLARLVDGSEHLEFRPGFGPEMYCGLVKVDGYLMGVIGNRQGAFPNYPEYTNQYMGVGGKLYRQGLIKMSEFVTLCSRDKVPMIWFQDTSGIDVGDIAEKAELLGLGQSLIYSIENSHLPMMLVVLRKGTAAAHYVLGGPTANNNNAFSLGTATTEINVMHGETAAAASYARRLVKEKDAGKPLQSIIDKMNEMVKHYDDTSGPVFCAKKGFVDEIVRYHDNTFLFRHSAVPSGCGLANHGRDSVARGVVEHQTDEINSSPSLNPSHPGRDLTVAQSQEILRINNKWEVPIILFR